MNGKFFPIQTVYLGRTGAFATYNEPSLQLPGQIGGIVEDSGKAYRLVKFDNGTGNVASIAGGAVYWKDRAAGTVTADQSDSQAGVNGVAGVSLGVVTDLYYCYVQVGGLSVTKVAAATAVGDILGGSATDTEFGKTAAGTASAGIPYGVAYSAVGTPVAGFSNVYLQLGSFL